MPGTKNPKGSKFEVMVLLQQIYLLRVSSYSYEKAVHLPMNLNLKTYQLPSLSCSEWTAHFFTANRLISLRSFTVITKYLTEHPYPQTLKLH